MIESHTYYRDDIDDWKMFFDRLPPEYQVIYNSPEYLVFLEESGFGKAFCQVFEKDDLFIYFPAILRKLPFDYNGVDLISSWYYGGPIPSWKDQQPLNSKWIDAITEGRRSVNAVCEFIRFDPNLMNQALLDNSFNVQLNRSTVFVDLKKSWEKIYGEFSSQNRRNVKHAEKCGLDVHIDQSETAWEHFAQIYQEEMTRKNGPPHLRFDDVFFKNLSRQKGFTLFIVEFEGRIIGGFIAAHGAKIAHHYLSAVNFDCWDKRPNNILFTRVVEYFYERNFDTFDFQGGRDGVFRFKKNFSATQGQFYVGKSIYDTKKYNELIDIAGGDHGESFPSYRN